MIQDTSVFKGTMDQHGGQAMIKVYEFWDEDAADYWEDVYQEPPGKGKWEIPTDKDWSDRLGRMCRAKVQEQSAAYGPFTTATYHTAKYANWGGHCWASRDCTTDTRCTAYDQQEYIAIENLWRSDKIDRSSGIHTHIPKFGTTGFGEWDATTMTEIPSKTSVDLILDIGAQDMMSGLSDPANNNVEVKILERAIANMTGFSTLWYDTQATASAQQHGRALKYWAPDAASDLSVKVLSIEYCDADGAGATLTPDPNHDSCDPLSFDYNVNTEHSAAAVAKAPVPEVDSTAFAFTSPADPMSQEDRRRLATNAELNMYEGWSNPMQQYVLDTETHTGSNLHPNPMS